MMERRGFLKALLGLPAAAVAVKGDTQALAELAGPVAHQSPPESPPRPTAYDFGPQVDWTELASLGDQWEPLNDGERNVRLFIQERGEQEPFEVEKLVMLDCQADYNEPEVFDYDVATLYEPATLRGIEVMSDTWVSRTVTHRRCFYGQTMTMELIPGASLLAELGTEDELHITLHDAHERGQYRELYGA